MAYTHTLTPRLLNDFRIGYHAVYDDSLNYFAMNGPDGAGAALGIPGFDGDVRYDNPGVPLFTISGFSGLGGGGTNWYQFDRTFQVSNVLAYTRGSHNIRTGFDARRLETGRRAANNPRGSFTFTGEMTGYAVSDFMLGVPRSVTTPVDQLQGHVGGWRTGYFINDTWQASRNLTLNLGLRYELHTPARTYEGFASMLNENQTGLIPTSFPAEGFEFHEPNRTDFAPRVGVAYRLGEKTVLRSGFGIYFNPNQMNTFTFLTNNPPLAAEFTFSSVPGAPTLTFDSPFGVVGPGGPPNVTSPNRHLPNARKDQWSFDVQRELWDGQRRGSCSMSARTPATSIGAFSATRPRPGPGAIDARRPNQNFRVIRLIQNDLYTNYHAVSVILRQRMTKGLQVNAHYTWSRTRDVGTNSNGGSSQNPGVDPFTQIETDYGIADWDVPHRFVASYIYDVPFFKELRQSVPAVRALRLAGGRYHDARERAAVRPDHYRRPGQYGHREPAAGSGRCHPVALVPAQPGGSRHGQLHRPVRVRAAGAVHVWQRAAQPAARSRRHRDGSVAAQEFPIGGKARFQIRADVFNAFNRVNFGNPNGASARRISEESLRRRHAAHGTGCKISSEEVGVNVRSVCCSGR